MVAVINSNKHYVHSASAAIANGAIRTIEITDAVNATVADQPNEVEEGSVVKAVHVEQWLVGKEATNTSSQFTLIVEKVPAGQASATVAQMANLGTYPNKKNVLYTTQGILGPLVDGQSTVPVIRDWVLIPKGKQRQGLGDKIVETILAVGALRSCGVSIYKEFR